MSQLSSGIVSTTVNQNQDNTEYIDGKEIKLEKGGIDCPPIQKKIINIMEGGKEAFNIRRNIYKIWEVANI